MRHETQVELLDELLTLRAQKLPFQDADWSQPETSKYLDPQRFEAERCDIFLKHPFIALHSSQLDQPGAFKTIEHGGRSLLLVRGDDNIARAFFNVCRHRGAQLVGEGEGCRQRFSCPYHAWTYSNSGELVAVPHEKTGFPGLDRKSHGLRQLGCAEYAGWIWVCHDPTHTPSQDSNQQAADQSANQSPGKAASLDIESYLGGLAEDVRGLGAQEMVVFQSEDWQFNVNWKLLAEGGLESYHFRIAHRKTIAELFLDNLSSYQCFGDHIRSVLARSNLSELADVDKSEWRIRPHANLIYTFFPTSQFLVQSDHIVWLQSEPLSANRTRVQLSTVIPAQENRPERQEYWQKNHALTMRTLREDFVIGEGIQRGLESGANAHFNHGRYEGALVKFNQSVERLIASA